MYLYQPRRTSEFDNENAHEKIYTSYQCIQQEARKSQLRNSLHFVYYNFAKVHKSLRVTPGMQAGLAKRVMSIEDVVNLVPEPVAKKRGSYKK